MATYRTRTGKDGTVSVHTMVRLAGYPTRTASFPNKREAAKWAATVEAEMIEGRHFKDANGRKRTIGEAIARFRAEVLPLKRNGSMYGFTLDWWANTHGTQRLGEVSRGWLASARAQLLTGKFLRIQPDAKRGTLTPCTCAHKGGPVPHADACPRKTQRFVQATPHTRTPATCNRYMAALSAVFSQVCGDWEWLQPAANPFTGFSKLPEGKGKGSAYTDDARARLLAQTAQDPQLHTLVQVALSTAARAGELLALTWSHVEIGETEGRLMFTDTKNGEARIAWLFGDALNAMKAQSMRLLGVDKPSTLTGTKVLSRCLAMPVFPGQWSHSKQLYGRYDYLPRLHKALSAAGLKMSRPFHALRHTAATTAARMGANAHQLKALGGWKSDAVNTYVHIAGQDSKDLSQALAKRLENKS